MSALVTLITEGFGTPQFYSGGEYLTYLILASPCITFQLRKIINSLKMKHTDGVNATEKNKIDKREGRAYEVNKYLLKE